MKRFVALVAVVVLLFSIVPVAAAEQYYTTQNTTLYATRSLNVRYGPSTQYAIVGSLKAGDAVQYLGQSGNWYLVSFNGQTGYSYGKYFAAAQPVVTNPQPVTGTSYVIAQTNVNVRTGPSTKYAKLGAIALGQSAALLGSSGNWYMIQWGAQTGYVYKKYFTLSAVPSTLPVVTPGYPNSSWPGTYPVYPGIPTYQDYSFGTANNEFFKKLEQSGYFTTNQNIYLGRFLDGDGVPCIRVANGANLNKVASDLKSILKSPGVFRLVNSGMPTGVNITYVNYMISQLVAIYQNLSSWQKSQLPIVGWGYDASRDAIVVQIQNLDQNKVNLFRTLVSNWPYVQFELPYYYIP